MTSAAMTQDAQEFALRAESARSAIERGDWGKAEQLPTDVQERTSRLWTVER